MPRREPGRSRTPPRDPSAGGRPSPGRRGAHRRGPGRGVSEIIATILLVAITVVLAAVLYVLIIDLTRSPNTTPIGAAVSFGGVAEQTNAAGTQWNYTTSVQTTTTGLTWSDLLFQVRDHAGTLVTVGPTQVVVTGTDGCDLASFSFATGLWGATGATCSGTIGGTAMVLVGETLQLQASADLSAAGDTLTAVGQGSFSGETSLVLA